MKSKLTLRIDDDVKKEAKRLAWARGESLSGLVEAYFRLLTEASATNAPGDEEAAGSSQPPSAELGPITQRIAGALAETSEHDPSKEAHRRAVAEAAVRKHG
jgi:hypothetical protein